MHLMMLAKPREGININMTAAKAGVAVIILIIAMLFIGWETEE